MSSLIRKGGFRERAHRSTRHTDSENKLTKLPERGYALCVTAEESVPSELLDQPVQYPNRLIDHSDADDVTEH